MVRTVSRWGFLLSLALLFACVEPGNDDDSADDDDSSDDDDAADDDDGIPLGPSGTVVGTLFDIETDEPIQATVHEHASDPINAVESTPVGYFELYPQSFADGQTTEFFAYSPSGDYVDLFVALTRDAYLRAGHGLELFMEPSLGWHETHETLYSTPWDPALGLLVVELDFESIDDVEETWVWIDAPYHSAFVFDSSGNLVPGDEIPKGTSRAQVIMTGVSPAPANIEVLPRDGIECSGPSSFDTLDNAILYAFYTCRLE